MMLSCSHGARVFGLFDKRIEGDDSLMELARLRFRQAGLGAEMHAGTVEQLDRLLRFRPSAETPVMVHLARDFDLIDKQSRDRIVDFALHFAGRVSGLIIHDRPEFGSRSAEYLRAALDLEFRLKRIEGCPMVFIEYAAGLEPAVFAGFFASIHELSGISACIDIGHVGIQAARTAYARVRPGEDICALKKQPSTIPQRISDLEVAVQAGLPTVLSMISRIGALGKPVHFHLHDAHPLSTFSSFGVSDHLGFLAEIPICFEHRGKRSLPLMFGPDALSDIARTAFTSVGPQAASFTLEIHPTAERLALGEAASLFSHWTDRTNAERMNHWLGLLIKNQELLARACSS
jgi:hypothetical protein